MVKTSFLAWVTYKDSFTTMKISQLQGFPVRLWMIAMQSIDYLGKNILKIEDILKIDWK